MPKEVKAPFASIKRPTDAQVFNATNGISFKKCPNCGTTITPSAKACSECLRLQEEGFGPTPRAPHATVRDTSPVQSYPSDNHSGYHDTISTRNIDPNTERY
jgi:hypothetical protein